MKTPSHGAPAKAANLMVRLDPASKDLLQRVASLKGVSTSDYVRSVVVTSARRDLVENERNVLSLSASEQAAFWRALAGPVELTPRQKKALAADAREEVSDVAFPEGFELAALASTHPRRAFTSGQEAVDRFLRERALQSQEKRLSSSRVLIELSSKQIAGYYALAMGQVSFGGLPPEVLRRLPKRDLPIAVLAWLGVDRAFQKRGLGERLLAQALRDCWVASQTFPFVAIVLDCLDEPTKAFYQRWDFAEVPGHPLRLFLGAEHLAAMMARP